ncbi:hypothetical protein, conserved [Eimeria maxima]|uniref:Apoptosis-antagonizing transcription factor C-terminal domain-containing protein n=1 Tax=Eimeria maxima TaxID=5804 RepID=U6MC58_EIMMA|nr:hypothetical protein, conserved [Eimeria maxima]CDJ60643.1 hypothetical protein, conserved [Eimeria maxima]
MTARVSGGPKRAPKRAAHWGAPRDDEGSTQGSSDEEITSSSSSGEEETKKRGSKRLQLDEGLLQRVRKVQQQQQQLQQQQQKKGQRLLLLGTKESKDQREQQKKKAEQLLLQRQLHAKLIGLRVTENTALRLANRFPAADVLQLLLQQQEETEAAITSVRKEAARTFVLLRQLQQLMKDSRFSVFNQPVSVQLKNAMESEEEKLLRRAISICGYCSSSSSSSSSRESTAGVNEQGEKEGEIGEKGEENNKKEAEIATKKNSCSVIACAELTKAKKESQHEIFDDTDFYVELLKASVAAGEGQVGSSTLTRETALLTAKRKAAAKTVDRRASKGRKIRYKPIPQLESFVSAIPWVPNTDVLPGADDPLVVEGLMTNLFAGS